MQQWYVDTCVLVSYYSPAPGEVEKKEIATKIFSDASDAEDLQLVSSHWTLTELTRILVKSHQMDATEVQKIVSNLIRKGRVEGAKINFTDLSPRKDYTFTEMFNDLQDGIMAYSVGFQDVLHTIIMKNNGIDTILTFDSGFESIDDIIVVDIDDQ